MGPPLLDHGCSPSRLQNAMADSLKTFKMDNDQVKDLRFLLYGPVGAGKSSIVNTIKTIFEGQQFVNCLAEAGSITGFTIRVSTQCKPPNLSRIINQSETLSTCSRQQTFGVEKELGVHTEHIISALRGHIKEGYVLKNVILNVNLYVCATGLPQVVFMTRVDLACPLTKADLHSSTEMQKCSSLLGVPVNCIFPVKNYNIETHLSDDINCLMLDALTQIVHWANEYGVKCSTEPTHAE
uniref:G domain-containing protein n=1 Tax=Electrophorus electricus TaxID=8005 RepID=A0A4W4FMJ2_ELEEL